MDSPTLLSPAAVAADLIGVPGASVTVQAPAPAAPAPAAPTPTPDGLIDAAGRVFDPARYKSHPDGTPRTYVHANGKRYFLPIGGRGRSAPAPVGSADPAPAAPSAPAAPAAPASTVIDLPPAPAAPAWSEAEKSAAAAPAAPAESETGAAPAAAAAVVVDCSDDAAEVAARALYLVVGAMTGAPDEATPAAAEHNNVQKALAAYVRSTGWRGTALAAALIGCGAYLCRTFGRPKSAEWLRGQLARVWRSSGATARPVASAAAPASTPAAPAAVRPVSSPVSDTFSPRSAFVEVGR